MHHITVPTKETVRPQRICYNETAKFTVTGVVFMRVDIVLEVSFFFPFADLFDVTQAIWINF